MILVQNHFIPITLYKSQSRKSILHVWEEESALNTKHDCLYLTYERLFEDFLVYYKLFIKIWL